MATGVGLRIADDECLAAIVSSTTPEPGAPAPEPIFVVREPVLHMSDDGDTELGGDPPVGHAHSITGFVSAVGDPAGIPVDEGEAYRAEDLVATALFCLIDLAAAHLNGPARVLCGASGALARGPGAGPARCAGLLSGCARWC